MPQPPLLCKEGNLLVQTFSPPCKGGLTAPSKKRSRSKKARTGWSLASNVSKCVLKHLRVSDHPVCGASGASRLLFDAAATPPLQGGESASPNVFPSLQGRVDRAIKKTFPFQKGADGVVAREQRFEMRFEAFTCKRPPRLRRF